MSAIDAYTSAWNEASKSGDFTTGAFERHFKRPPEAAQLDLSEWDFFHDLWLRRVPPKSLHKELKRSRRHVRRHLVDTLFRMFQSSVPAWLAPPSDVDLFDFDPGVDNLFEVELGPDYNAALAERCRREAPTDDDGDPDLIGWIRPTPRTGEIDVMIGSRALATTQIPEATWTALSALWDKRVATHGSVYLTGDPDSWSFDFWYGNC